MQKDVIRTLAKKYGGKGYYLIAGGGINSFDSVIYENFNGAGVGNHTYN